MTDRYSDLVARLVAVEMNIEELVFARAREAGSILAELDPTHRRPVMELVKKELLLKQGRRCAICGKILEQTEMDADHVIPVRFGGGNERANLRMTHVSCNRARGAELKGHVDIDLLVQYIEDAIQNLPDQDRMAFGLK